MIPASHPPRATRREPPAASLPPHVSRRMSPAACLPPHASRRMSLLPSREKVAEGRMRGFPGRLQSSSLSAARAACRRACSDNSIRKSGIQDSIAARFSSIVQATSSVPVFDSKIVRAKRGQVQ